MGDLATLLLLLVLLAIAGIWLMLSRARDRAIQEARWRCQQHGLQLLDETVGLSGLRLRRFRGQRVVERRYSFEVSIDGDDREAGHLWMVGSLLTALILPTVELYTPEHPVTSSTETTEGTNVVPFRRQYRDRDIRH
ncbi:DUF3301 domain-containing protein [Dyella nitratireducens]|uniref:DUF3301 domain-containing protein n=1 Tax=Dyella nitratireducens TaxID=1849580 RepID=A0ABQ1FXZ7_9GAMM|nr:DUF3301 domain-containing protein [Dyella nitratireducens]GGA33643.1 hypothetical protein GCM10010981_23210 [Dyella nitratireducens]GLQ40755.1 hypothetical protein GCM10007902_06050 [Dyella nitratireducens]